MTIANEEQAEFWGNSPSGAKWLTYEDQMDALLAPVLDLVLERAALQPGQRVLDIGCGTGASTILAAQAVGPDGHVLAADFSQPFLKRAAERAQTNSHANIGFQFADAQTHPFEEGDRDILISRFGVMFFEDTVAAFANMARALKPGGRMCFAAWGPLSGNPWFRLPHIAATERLGTPPKVDRNAPGPLAFHDQDRVSGLLAEAGLTDITVDAVPLTLPVRGTLEDSAALCTRIGPAARVIAHFDGTPEDVAAIRQAVAEEFRPYATGDVVEIPALINLFQARRPG
ncbi:MULTISPECIES: class I SAM-dependent methyltransferase [unclassified Ruegeria]|uniref:class I SAM-dependent methyltransferase n=1 Tax=unclassified Ruegeria TaxID=2625375 RepID=UPI001ADC1A0D|nr:MULTISPECIES: class I SAM-dependent methyltransferase [unclassified Ruegeria]MBO9410682.1 methyltransferase domain-containing protein [Ruegeria sp. R8_1]MBO9414099.1 methyltransferase domain-containing protein [Ruegeria sp. R8_2]